MTIQFEGKSINYTVRGRGNTVVLLHGYMENSVMWDFIVPQLSDHSQVVTIDLPGHGQSENIESELTMPKMALVVKVILDHLEVNQAAFCGHSMGGYVSLAFASEYPKRVSKLVLYHSTAFADDVETRLRRKLGHDLLSSSPRTSIRASFSRLFYQHEGIEDLITFYTDEALKGDVDAYISANKGMASREDLGEVLYYNRPTFFIAGKHDPVVSKSKSQQQMDFLGPNDSFWLEKSGHMSYIEEMTLARSILLAILP